MITRLKDFVKYKLNESTSTGERTLEDYFKEKGIDLAKQRELATLNCAKNKLTSLKGIENCTNLTRLYCEYNDLTSLKGIENLTSLNYLYCRDNVLASLEGIENLTNLTILSCSHNNLTSLEGIENCTKLTRLYCGINSLTSLKGIENLKLTELSCSGNDLPFNNYHKMYINEIKDSFYLVKYETEISSILYSITDEYDINTVGFRYEFNNDVRITVDLLKELNRVSKKLKMLGITVDVTIGKKLYSVADLTDIYLNQYISQIHLKVDK